MVLEYLCNVDTLVQKVQNLFVSLAVRVTKIFKGQSLKVVKPSVVSTYSLVMDGAACGHAKGKTNTPLQEYTCEGVPT